MMIACLFMLEYCLIGSPKDYLILQEYILFDFPLTIISAPVELDATCSPWIHFK